MKRHLASYAIPTLLLLVGTSAIGTASGSAESCFRTPGSGKGAFTNSGCGVGGGLKNWIIGSDTFNWQELAAINRYCVKVQTGLASWYEDATCSKLLGTTSLYTEVIAFPGFFWGINPLKGRNIGKQTLHTTAGDIECEELTLGGKATAEKETSQIITASYGKCKAFGAAVTVSEAEYEITAEGQLSIVNKNITVTDSEAKCTVVFSDASSNKGLGSLSYTNTAGGKIDIALTVGGVSYEPSGGACGAKGATNGTIEGEGELEQEGVSVVVKLFPLSEAELGPLLLVLSGKVSELKASVTGEATILEGATSKKSIKGTKTKATFEGCKELQTKALDTADCEGLLTLEGAKLGAVACRSESEARVKDAAETILVKLEAKLADETSTGKALEPLLISKVLGVDGKELTINCGVVKEKVRGEEPCLLLPGLKQIGANEKIIELSCTQKEGLLTTGTCDETPELCEELSNNPLEANFTGKYEPAAEELKLLGSFNKDVFIDD